MSTNYYIHKPNNVYCPHCGGLVEERFDEIHIGKSYYGWCFLFNGTIYSTYKDWLDILTEYKDNIFDEYDNNIKLDAFLKYIEELSANPSRTDSNFYYDGSYEYSDCDFS